MPKLLIVLLFLPLATSIVVACLGSSRTAVIRWVSLSSTLICLALALVLCFDFARPRLDGSLPSLGDTFAPKMKTTVDLLNFSLGEQRTSIQFFVGIDGLNVWLVLLTAFLMVPAVLISWTSIEERVPEYFAWLLALETGMLGVFLAFDIILFYVFFELTLVPLFFLIGIWGGSQRQYAARKFFIFTLAGSLITLLGVLGVVLTMSQDPQTHKLSFSIPKLVQMVGDKNRLVEESTSAAKTARLQTRGQELKLRSELAMAEADLEDAGEIQKEEMRAKRDEAQAKHIAAEQALEKAQSEENQLRVQSERWSRTQYWLFLAMLIGFAIKVPLVPVHTWLPLAHVEAPTAGSVLLAGVLLKIGTYGFLRLCLPLTPDACLSFGAPLIGVLAVIGIIYGAFCALAQDDIKKLVAYSSVSHLGFAMLGLFALNETGLTGSMLQMVNHGLSTGALFLLVGMLYERYHTRRLEDYGGMASRMKVLAFFLVFITMSSIGLPGLNGFVGELLVLMGMYNSPNQAVAGAWLTAFACLGIVLGAWYMLNMLRQAFFGEVKTPHVEGEVRDMNGREWATLAPIAALCLLLGLYPKPFVDTVSPDVKVVTRIVDRARERAEQ